MSDYDPDTRPTIACPNPKCGHSIIIPPLIGEMGDRHPKWQRVEPGTVIPAGQPYRVEYDPSWSTKATAVEMLGNDVDWKISEIDSKTFIDSSWKPPLVLPTEPTWGIAVFKNAVETVIVGPWHLIEDGRYLKSQVERHSRSAFTVNVADFIPLTDEQVARIEARS